MTDANYLFKIGVILFRKHSAWKCHVIENLLIPEIASWCSFLSQEFSSTAVTLSS